MGATRHGRAHVVVYIAPDLHGVRGWARRRQRQPQAIDVAEVVSSISIGCAITTADAAPSCGSANFTVRVRD